jgi:hypothetical protein
MNKTEESEKMETEPDLLDVTPDITPDITPNHDAIFSPDMLSKAFREEKKQM